MKRITILFLLVSLAFNAVFATGGKDKESGGGYTFKVGFAVTSTLCAAPFYIAIAKDYFGNEGLKWERINIGDGETMNLLTTGQVDGTNSLLATLIQPLANGLDVQIPLALHTGCIKVLVKPGSAIKTPADLKGKTIGAASPSASPTIIAKRYLANAGFRVEGENPDVQFIFQSAAELPLLLERGVVDAIALNDPSAQIVENDGRGVAIINTATDDYLKDEFCCVVAVRTETLKNHAEETAKFLRAIQKAAQYVQENPEESAQILAANKFVPGDPIINGQILKTYDYRASVSQALPAIQRNSGDLQKLGLLAKDVDVGALAKNTFVEVHGVPDSLYH
ncbi:MAG: ABC transporter substrate-binding protein [Spirochaetaceae bacterium]|jgi:NitT/TauT family transport system substrate-binding protein|nr:ABC transporter substrate-binding protein [Spirochaetaceae bacterium]